MNHPQITRQRDELLSRIDEAQEAWENATGAEQLRFGRILDRLGRQLEYLDMADADPAAHGYEQGV